MDLWILAKLSDSSAVADKAVVQEALVVVRTSLNRPLARLSMGERCVQVPRSFDRVVARLAEMTSCQPIC